MTNLRASAPPPATFELARRRHRDGRIAEAESLYRKVLDENPEHAEALFLLGALALESDRSEIALDLLTRAVELAPDNPAYRSNLGLTYRRLGRTEEAIVALVQAVSLRPDLPEISFNLGLALEDHGELDDAIVCYERAADLKPDVFAVQYRLATALKNRGQWDKAVGHYQCAVSLQPTSLEAIADLGVVLHGLGRLDGAEALLRRALALMPDHALSHNNLGNVLLDRKRVDEAIMSFRRALAISPTFSLAHGNLGNALKDCGLVDEALDSYRRALAHNADHHVAHSSLVYTMSFSPGQDAEAIANEARNWGSRHADRLSASMPAPSNDRMKERRLRIGYVSPDFRDHCEALFTLPLLRHHDRERFEIYCYASVLRPDGVTDLIRRSVDAWRDIAGMSDSAAADLIREDRVDVLVDLTMHLDRGRLLLFARKPAPVQICWLAYPGTTGVRAIDYRLTDPYLDHLDGDDSAYTERSIRLPDTFWCYHPLLSGMSVSSLPAGESGHVTFGCLNNFCKVNLSVLDLWANVLTEVEDARLILLAPTGEARRRTLAHFEQRGVRGERIEFVARMPRADYLATYRRIDVCLDTFPCNGHTTSMDAFWMGVPVLTLAGRTVVGRAGLSQAMNLGLPELIARTPEEYVDRARALASDRHHLSALRSGLRERMEASPLMDAPRFAKNVESAYRSAWQRWCEESA